MIEYQIEGLPTKDITLKDVLTDMPDWIKMLPESWDGPTKMVFMNFPISKIALKNSDFDVKGFISFKLKSSLLTIMHKHLLSEIHLTNHFLMFIDDKWNRSDVHIHLEYSVEYEQE